MDKSLSAKQKKTLIYVFLVAFLLRTIFIFSFHNYDDIKRLKIGGEEMIQIATNIVKGYGFSGKFLFDKDTKPTAVMAPLYPYFLALFIKFFGMKGYLIVELIQAIFSSFICIIIYLTGLKIFNNERTALIASILSVFYLPLIYYCTVIWSAIFFVFLITLYILNLLKYHSDQNQYNIFVLGLILGITLLTDPVIILFIPLSLLWFLLNLKTGFKTSLKNIILILGLSLIIVMPWTVRNYMVFNKFIFIKSTIGFNFWVGNNPYATGVLRLVNKDNTEYQISEQDFNYLSSIDESTRDRFFISSAITFIRENPKEFIRLSLKKFSSFWWEIENKNTGFNDNTKIKTMKLTYGIPFILALFGMILSYNQIKSCSLILFFLVSLSLTYSITMVAVYRFRFPVEPYLLLFAAVTISKIADRFLIRNKV